jgi:predicted dehydrogenase
MTDKLRVGLIGTGFGKTTQLPGFQAREDVEVVAVCSGQLAKAQATAQEFHIRSAYNDYREMLAKETLDLVSVVTPPQLHKAMTLAALQAGAHVLCEKPMALDVAEAQAMCEAARHAKRIGMINHEFRYQPWRAYAKTLIDEGYIGRPYHINVFQLANFRGDPLRPWNWWSNAAQGGGMLGAIGSHVVDAIRYCVGEPIAICGFVDTQITQRPDGRVMRPVTSDDNCAFLARFDNGATASVHLSAVSRPSLGEHIRIMGSDGALVMYDGKLFGGKASDTQLTELPIPDTYKHKYAGLIGPFTVLLNDLVNGIRDGASEVHPSFEDGLVVQRVLDAVRASSGGAGWVKA